MRVQNPTNGFVRVESSNYVIVCDPWLGKGIFDGSWVPYPAIVDEESLLDGVTHCFVSHIHEDHFDVKTLGRLPRDTHVLVPAVYPNHLMAKRATQMGFREPLMLTPKTAVEVAPGLSLEVIPRMNAYGQELDLYEDTDIVSLVIDNGVMISVDGLKLVFLADNVPYQPSDAEEALEHMKGCDLLAFSYNGAASDYPLCYESWVRLCRCCFRRSAESKLAKAPTCKNICSPGANTAADANACGAFTAGAVAIGVSCRAIGVDANFERFQATGSIASIRTGAVPCLS